MKDNEALWILGGLGVLVGIYHLFLKSSGRPTETMPLPPRESPLSFENTAQVATRFNQVRELFKMGYIDAPATYEQLDVLLAALESLKTSGKADIVTVQDLASRISAFIDQVRDYEATVLQA